MNTKNTFNFRADAKPHNWNDTIPHYLLEREDQYRLHAAEIVAFRYPTSKRHTKEYTDSVALIDDFLLAADQKGLLLNSTGQVIIEKTPVSGVVINALEMTGELAQSSCPAPHVYADGQLDWDDAQQDWMIKMQEELDKLTTKYMCGSTDGVEFYFSDCSEGIEAIKKVFPTFKIVNTFAEAYPLDYNYIRDGKPWW